jgi:methylmalonyl-CoA mutase N-terminal domain/subunit
MYRVVGDERGIAGDRLTGTIQNDILKEYTAQNEYIYPPDPSVRLVVDSMAYCAEVMPRFNPVSVSGYHIREAGATAPEEVGLTLAAALTYLERGRERGIEPDSVAPRRRSSSTYTMTPRRDRQAPGSPPAVTRRPAGGSCRRPSTWLLRSACPDGEALTAQQPSTTWPGRGQTRCGLGGAQSLHEDSLDEAYSIPSEQAIKVAVRTQQILLHETGVGDVVDPLAGSYYIERLTTDIEDEARALIERIDGLGGLVETIKSGYAGQLIANSSWEQQRAIESGERTVIGVNAYVDEAPEDPDIATFALDRGVLERQLARLAATRASRGSRRAGDALREVRRLADVPEANLMPAIEEAVRARCTVGEICNVLRDAWGEYRPPTTF